MLTSLLACVHPPAVIEPPAVTAPAPELAELLTRVRGDGDRAWHRLAELCDDIGARPAGSEAYLNATVWAEAGFRADGLSTARREPVTHNVWRRGPESLVMTAPRPRSLAVLGLGGTVGASGLEAAVVVVKGYDDLSEAVRGKIVLYNVPMGTEPPPAGPHYGVAVDFRANGAAKAAKFGAVAALVRSVTTRSLYTPHTGGMRYEEGVPKIPTAAIPVEDAEQIQRLTDRGIEVRLRLDLADAVAADALGANVVAEIPGTTHPEEIVLLGAHLDSWDVGCGAQDDGAGVVQVMEAMRALSASGRAPKRTIRAVLFDNEEFGLSGGKAYFAAHGTSPHFVAMETDSGGGAPVAWGISAPEATRARFTSLLAPLGLPVREGGGGADIGPLADVGVPLVGFIPDDSHYFDIHHTHADTVDKVDPAHLREGVAAITGFAWLAANAE